MINLVEQHIIRQDDERFAKIDEASFAAKNLYNKANYILRQTYIFEHDYIPFKTLYHMVKNSSKYKALPRKVSQLILKQLNQNWQDFFAAAKAYQQNPGRFLGQPKLPKYKDKKNGRVLLIYNYQAISHVALRQGIIRPSQLGISIKTNQKKVSQVRIVPRKSYYVVEVVYKAQPQNYDLDRNLVAGIDLGIDNLATLTSNKQGFVPQIINGRPLKSINQFYNKQRAKLQSFIGQGTSNRLHQLTNKRNRKIKHYLHVASRRLINHLVKQNIGTLVIGYNKKWKQKVNIGRQNNQKFVSIPFSQFIHMLTYKAKLVGICVVMQEESYTSKCSFLDLEPIRKQNNYKGTRVKRGLFQAGNGQLINADVNGSLNIIRKAIPDAFSNGIEGIVVCPLRITFS